MIATLVIPFAMWLGNSSAGGDARFTAFQQKVGDYAVIRKAAMATSPKLPNQATPEQIQASENALADAIRSKRTGAKQGDMFDAQVEPAFREILKSHLAGGTNKEERATVKQGNPAVHREPGEAAPVIQINAVYPQSSSLSSLPPLLLHRLPQLPEDIEYRFVGNTLVLLDCKSRIIIDYLKGAAPKL